MEFMNAEIVRFSYDAKENHFICEVKAPCSDCRFVFLLIKDGKKVEEVRWIENNRYIFKHYGDGIYYCQIEAKNKQQYILKRSQTIECFSDKYRLFLDEKFSHIPSQSYYASLSLRDYPNDDFCIMSSENAASYDIEISGLNTYRYNNSIIVTNGNLYKHNNKTYIMSGICITDDHKYIRGGEDIVKYNIQLERLFFCLGKYSFVLFDEDEILLANDYHGQNKLYYFSDKKTTFISNRLHLLVLCLKKMKIKLEMFHDKALALLCCRYHQLFMHNFCSEMLIRNIFQSYAGEKFSIKNGKLEITHGGIYDILSQKYDTPMSEEEYSEKLDNACKEIINNISAIVNSEHTQEVVIDVSGGMDSRVSLAALTNIKTSKPIYYRIIKSEKIKENEIALLLAGLYNYKFFEGNDLKIKYSQKDFISFCMETKYLRRLSVEYCNKGIAQLTGFYGEAGLRPRYSQAFYFNSFLQTISDDVEYVNKFFYYYISPYMVVDYHKSGYKLHDIFKQEFLSVYGKDVPSKLENYYLNYGASYHFNPSTVSQYALETFAPIKSKILFEIHRHNALLWKNIKIGLDLTYKLNPVLSKIKYENEIYNTFYDSNYADLKVSQNPVHSNMLTPHGEDRREEWEKSFDTLCKNIQKLEQNITDSDAIDILNYWGEQISTQDEIAAMLNYCMENNNLFMNIKYPLYHFIEIAKDNRLEMNLLFNKLATVTYFMSIADTEKKTAPTGTANRQPLERFAFEKGNKAFQTENILSQNLSLRRSIMLYDEIMEAVESSLHSPFDWKSADIKSRLDRLTMLCHSTLNSKETQTIDYAYVNKAVAELSYFPHAAARVYELFHLYEICSIKNRFGSLEGHYIREKEKEIIYNDVIFKSKCMINAMLNYEKREFETANFFFLKGAQEHIRDSICTPFFSYCRGVNPLPGRVAFTPHNCHAEKDAMILTSANSAYVIKYTENYLNSLAGKGIELHCIVMDDTSSQKDKEKLNDFLQSMKNKYEFFSYSIEAVPDIFDKKHILQ